METDIALYCSFVYWYVIDGKHSNLQQEEITTGITMGSKPKGGLYLSLEIQPWWEDLSSPPLEEVLCKCL